MNRIVAFCMATFSPSAHLMCQVKPPAAKEALEKAFTRWGLPLRLRFDNGHPFANTSDRTLPTALALWLVSLGIDLHFNRPYSPQQNGSVECTQRISHRWANPKKCKDASDLQRALDLVAKEHLEVYRLRKYGDKTRRELYPALFQNPRKYEPENIDPQKVKDYLLPFAWQRKVYGNGRLSIFGKTWKIGSKYKHQPVMIRFNPDTDSWQVTRSNGEDIGTIPLLDLSKKALAELTVFQKT